MNRRNFLTAGTLTMGAFGLPNISLSKEAAKKSEKSVIMLFLSGGMSHAESFIAAPDSTDRYRSVTGYVKAKDGFYLGGHWDRLAENSNLYSLVHSFSHVNPSHGSATHFTLTGYNARDEQEVNHPSMGSVISRSFGANEPNTGMPRYVALDNIHGLNASYLGSAYNPLVMGDEGKKNLALNVSEETFLARKYVLEQMDRDFNKKYNKQIDMYKKQGYSILLGNVKDAFAIEKEPESVHKAYGPSHLGRQALAARRLIESGVRFVTLVEGGWDLHSDIKPGMERLVPNVDSVMSTLMLDLKQRGLLDSTLIVISTEFGRTPINATAGRDHWSRNTPLLIGGGKYQGKGIIGTVDKTGFEVTSKPYGPTDILATVLDHMNISGGDKYLDTSGRPRYLIEGNASVIGA